MPTAATAPSARVLGASWKAAVDQFVSLCQCTQCKCSGLPGARSQSLPTSSCTGPHVPTRPPAPPVRSCPLAPLRPLDRTSLCFPEGQDRAFQTVANPLTSSPRRNNTGVRAAGAGGLLVSCPSLGRGRFASRCPLLIRNPL